jgi:ATP-dependent DNA helicase RecQ
MAELMRVSGIGERKAELYGREILEALKKFGGGARAAGASPPATAPGAATLRLLEEGKTLAEIAQIRGRQISTVVATVAELIEAGRVKLDAKWISPEAGPLIEAACLAKGVERLRDIKDAVPAYVSYDDIRLVVAGMRAEGKVR